MTSDNDSDTETSDAEDEHATTTGTRRPYTGCNFKAPDEKFTGNSHKLEQWIFNLEEYYQNANTRPDLKAGIAASKLSHNATVWWRTHRIRNQVPKTWKDFKKEIRARFITIDLTEAKRARFSHIRQTGSIARYNAEFQTAMSDCRSVAETEAFYRYIDGLNFDTMEYMQLQKPKTLCKVM